MPWTKPIGSLANRRSTISEPALRRWGVIYSCYPETGTSGPHGYPPGAMRRTHGGHVRALLIPPTRDTGANKQACFLFRSLTSPAVNRINRYPPTRVDTPGESGKLLTVPTAGPTLKHEAAGHGAVSPQRGQFPVAHSDGRDASGQHQQVVAQVQGGGAAFQLGSRFHGDAEPVN